MIELTRSSIEDDPAILAEMGRVVVLWSLVNRSLDSIVFRHGTTEDRAQFYAKGTDRNRIERATKLWKEHEADHARYREMLGSLDCLKDLLETRNLIVHGLPAVTYQGGTLEKIAVIADPKISRQGGKPLNAVLADHSKEVRFHASVLDDILTEHIAQLLDNPPS